MSEPLWSDKTIDECFSDDDELHYATRMRDEYEARIAQLEAALAETWQPVADGMVIYCPCGNPDCYNNQTVTRDGSVLESAELGITLGNLRLCHKAATVAAEPVVDWDKYSEEYRWFAVDSVGHGRIYSNEPQAGGWVWHSGTGDSTPIGDFNLKTDDWRATLTERPNQPPSGVTKA